MQERDQLRMRGYDIDYKRSVFHEGPSPNSNYLETGQVSLALFDSIVEVATFLMLEAGR